MGASATSTNRIAIYQYDKIFNRAIERLRLSCDISEDDRNNILRLVEHLLAENMSRLRVVKYIDHLRVLARMAGKPLGELRRDRRRRGEDQTGGPAEDLVEC